jgi:hypothetical protein
LVILLWRAVVISLDRAGLGRGDPDQVALLVGQCEKQQAMGLVFA